MTTTDLSCTVLGQHVRLHHDPAVFAPTLTTRFLTDQVDLARLPGSTVLDLGCGSGPIGIAAALCGAREVHAIDLQADACALARRNAALNGVTDRVTVVQGDLFDPVGERRFDLIVDDVSGVAEEVARISGWFPGEVPSGGADGTRHAVRMLQAAPAHLARGGYLLFPLLSLSRMQEVLRVAREAFGDRVRRVASKRVPFNQALRRHAELLDRLKREGWVNFEQVRSRRFWTLDIYRADAPA